MSIRTRIALLPIVTAAVLLVGSSASGQAQSPEKGKIMSLTLTSTAFARGSEIPHRYTCEAEDISPALSWSGAPAGIKSFAMIVDDPDAPRGTWTHWLIWNIPGTATGVSENTPKTETLAEGARQGSNDFKRIGYNGPCPPPGKPHRYAFKLYALSAPLDLKAGASKSDLEAAMKPHILAHTEYIGIFKR